MSDISQVLTTMLSIQRHNDVVSLLIAGKEVRDIEHYLNIKYGITDTDPILIEARQTILKRKDYELENLLKIHVIRYEKIYADLFEMKAFYHASNAMKAKEKLMGFHKEGFSMKVTQNEMTALGMSHVDNEYNVMKLSENKRIRMTELLDKAKREKQLK